MRRGLLTGMMLIVVVLSLLAGCEDDNNASQAPAATNTAVKDSSTTDETLDGLGQQADSDVSTNTESGNNEDMIVPDLTPPYLSLSGHPFPRDVQVAAGNRMWAYYELTEPAPDGAFLALVPKSLEATDAPSNKEAALEIHQMGDETYNKETGTYLGSPCFHMMTPGEYVFRIFLGDFEDDEVFLESESFTIFKDNPAEAQTGEPGGQQ